MPVPRRRTSKSKRDRRRTHKKLSPVTLQRDPETGGWKRPHRASVTEDGATYHGRTVPGVKTKTV